MNAFTSGTAVVSPSLPRVPSTKSSAKPGPSHRHVEIARRWLALASIVADLASPRGTPSRLVHLNVSYGFLAQATAPWGARFWEECPPPGVQPVEWLFGSQTAISCLEDALELLDETHGLVTCYALTL